MKSERRSPGRSQRGRAPKKLDAMQLIDEVIAIIKSGSRRSLPVSSAELHALVEQTQEGWHFNWVGQGLWIEDYQVPEYDPNQASLLRNAVREERYWELEDGARPTARERAQWKKAWIDYALSEDPEKPSAVILREIRGSDGQAVIALVVGHGVAWEYAERIEALAVNARAVERYLERNGHLAWTDEPTHVRLRREIAMARLSQQKADLAEKPQAQRRRASRRQPPSSARRPTGRGRSGRRQ